MSRSDNRTNRLRAALRYLDEQGGAANRLDVWNAARTRVPLEGEELEPNQKGKPQGQSDFFWGSAGLVHAGFLTTRRPVLPPAVRAGLGNCYPPSYPQVRWLPIRLVGPDRRSVIKAI